MSTDVWRLPPLEQPDRLEELRRSLGVSQPAAEILARRGLDDPDTAEHFLSMGAADLHDAFTLTELPDAAQRLAKAVAEQEKIVIHGDYDADGITGAALLSGALRRIGAVVEPFVPDRAIDGYGVSSRLVEHAGKAGVGLLVTVDTGSSAREQLARARALGIDVIVCDHHLFDGDPPEGIYLLNPQRPNEVYPNPFLCGCAVAYKLLVGLDRVLGGKIDLARELDLVAVGLLADQMPIQGENRALVRLGLERLNTQPRPGIAALIEVARIRGRVDASDVAFQIAPRINAAGRIEKARTAVQVLMAEDLATARKGAQRLDSLNKQRKEIDALVTEEALEQAGPLAAAGDAGLVVASPGWHMGVVGITAAKIVQAHNRPAIVLAVDGEEARGSARTASGIHLKEALDQCAPHLQRYGGHAAAAGMTLRTSEIEGFRKTFASVVAQMPKSDEPAGLRLDAVLPLAQLNPEMASFVERLGPYGEGNREPLLAAYGVSLVGTPEVVGGRHLRLTLRQDGAPRSFIGFGLAERYAKELPAWPLLDVAFQLRYREGSPFDPWELRVMGLRPRAD